MSDHLKLTFKPGEIPGFQKDILTMGLCPLFLPVGTVEEPGRLMLLYDTGGRYFPDQITDMRAFRALSILRSLLEGMLAAERRYFPAGSYQVGPDILMVDPRDDSVHLIYIPARYPDRDTFMKDLQKIAVALRQWLPEEESGYLDEAASYFSIRSGLTILQHRLSMLENEAIVVTQGIQRGKSSL